LIFISDLHPSFATVVLLHTSLKLIMDVNSLLDHAFTNTETKKIKRLLHLGITS